MGNLSGVTWPDLINPRVRTAIGELYDHVFGESRDSATIKCGRVQPDGSRQVQRRLPPEEIDELVACYLAGATALALAGKHSIHRTTVLALLERHRVSRRGRVLTPDHIERAVSLYALGLSCASIGKELQVNPETVRQALLKASVPNAQTRAATSQGRLIELHWRYRDGCGVLDALPPVLLPRAFSIGILQTDFRCPGSLITLESARLARRAGCQERESEHSVRLHDSRAHRPRNRRNVARPQRPRGHRPRSRSSARCSPFRREMQRQRSPHLEVESRLPQHLARQFLKAQDLAQEDAHLGALLCRRACEYQSVDVHQISLPNLKNA